MVQLNILALAWMAGSAAGVALPCCLEKTVGGVSYILVKEADTRGYNCLANCVYEKYDQVQTDGQLFCFAAGDLEVVCGGDGEFTEKPGGPEEPGPGQSPSPTPAPAPAPEGGNSTCYPDTHTMIVYPGPAAVCGYELYFSGMDQATKDLILDKHNQLRQNVASGGEAGQPGASNMRKFVWNDELGDIAQRWAAQCNFGHDEMRNMCDGTYVGQNAWFYSETEEATEAAVMAKVPEAAQSWYDEVTNPGFSSADINPYVFGHGTGHYTQVVWAETYQLGCGMVHYEDDDGWFNTLVICNYAEGGNLEGGVMYQTGAGCGNCPAGTACDATYSALCA